MPTIHCKPLCPTKLRWEKFRIPTFTKKATNMCFAIHAHFGYVYKGRRRIECVFCTAVHEIMRTENYKQLLQMLPEMHRKGCPLTDGSVDEHPNVPVIPKASRLRRKIFTAKYRRILKKTFEVTFQRGLNKNRTDKLGQMLSEWNRLHTFNGSDEIQSIKAARNGLIWLRGHRVRCVFCSRTGKLDGIDKHDVYPVMTGEEAGNQPIHGGKGVIVPTRSKAGSRQYSIDTVLIEGFLREGYRPDILQTVITDYFLESGFFPDKAEISQRYHSFAEVIYSRN